VSDGGGFGVAALLTESGAAVLAAAAEVTLTDPLRAAADLARACPDAPPELRAAALTQVALRRHAADRFGEDAARMFFTRAGLEQCTRPTVAAHRAASLRTRAPDARTALDLCCGLGSDLVALARAGFGVTGVDRDPEALVAARANLAAVGLAGQLVEADVTAGYPGSADVIVADPARRTEAGARLRDPEQFSPPWSWVRSLLDRPGVGACVTTTPALAHRDIPAGCEAEWVDDAGSTVELAVWSPALTERGIRRRATLLGPAGSRSVTDADDGAHDVPDVRDPEPGDWILEPRGAILRAGLLGALAARVAGSVPGPGIGYLLTADPSPAAELAAAFRVGEVLPVRRAVLRRRLRELGAGAVEILARGVEVDVPVLRDAILTARAGSAAVTLVLTRTRSGACALVVERAPAVSRT
jgi:SAM-dependent methyltransferase